ncbi:MAG: PAS domain-containing protein [Alphaproteobacteria bacterium]
MEKSLTGKERTFDEDEIIVSKTDTKGIITYANDIFLKISGYEESEILYQPHNIIRHPEMPRCIYKLLWDTVQSGKELFAYVNNRAKNGDNYWVFAHITPCFDNNNKIIGYHSNRRVPKRDTLNSIIIPLYRELLNIEKKYSNIKEGMNTSYAALMKIISDKGLSYEEFIFSI